MTTRRVVTLEEWQAARADLLEREKELTRLGDELANQVRELPWVRVEKEYTFQTADGPKALPELFEGRSQLVIYHFMFGPSYAAGCPTNSSIADGFDGLTPHLAARDVTIACVSGAPIEKLLAFRERMGWSFPWVSTADSEFNLEMGVSSTPEATREWAEPLLAAGEMVPIATQSAEACGTDLVSYLAEGFGVTVFARDGDVVYRTYASSGRGVEFLMTYYPILDRTARGRDEGDAFQTWLRRHDEYQT
jgi:predicted dithiol-disulfide oxidoreductase (DUF899 family)